MDATAHPLDGTGWTGLHALDRLDESTRDELARALPDDVVVPAPGADAGIHGVAVVEGREPLVRIDDRLPCTSAYRRRGLPGTVEGTWVRAGVAERLAVAQSRLPTGLSLHVLDGWRSLATQQALWDEVYFPGSTAEPGWIADPSDTVVPPPHTTGAAVDLTLAWHGTPLALGTDFDAFEPEAHLLALEEPPADPLARDLRRLLSATLRAADFDLLAEEWWHVSYGDQRWALHRATHARYAPVADPTARSRQSGPAD